MAVRILPRSSLPDCGVTSIAMAAPTRAPPRAESKQKDEFFITPKILVIHLPYHQITRQNPRIIGCFSYLCRVNRAKHIVAFTGHRSYNGVADEQLRATIISLYERGARTFRVGMAEGFDLHAGEIVAELKLTLSDIILEACIPWPGFASRFSPEERERYARVLAAASVIRYASGDYAADVFHRRNDMLIDGAATVVAWWEGHSSGTGYTVRRARRQGSEVINLFVRDLFAPIF